jgi:hypothetical protein
VTPNLITLGTGITLTFSSSLIVIVYTQAKNIKSVFKKSTIHLNIELTKKD